MNDGIINNNILVTLNTIFAINTPIYISGEVYYIADVQWTQGDWAIDTKEKPVSFDVSKIKNPYIYSAVVNDDICPALQAIFHKFFNTTQLFFRNLCNKFAKLQPFITVVRIEVPCLQVLPIEFLVLYPVFTKFYGAYLCFSLKG
jgi:hypothetical protein